MTPTSEQGEAPASAEELERQARLAARQDRLRRVSPRPALWIACILPVVVIVLVTMLGPGFAPEADPARIRLGGQVGALLGLVVAYATALWVVRCSRPEAKPTAFLQPVALGFLLKLFLLGVGTVLFAKPLSAHGSHEAFAIAFAASAFGYQLLFQLIFDAARQRALKEPGG